MGKNDFSLFDKLKTKKELVEKYGIDSFEKLVSSIPRNELEPDSDYDSKSLKLYLEKLVKNLSFELYDEIKCANDNRRDEIRSSFLEGINDEVHKPITRFTEIDRAYDVAFRLKTHFANNLSKYLTIEEIKISMLV